MTKKELVPRLNEWVDIYKEAKQTTDNLYKYLGITVGANQIDIIWRAFEAYTETLAELIGDETDWLMWYYVDNQMGKGKMKARKTTKEKYREVKNLTDLIYFIEK